MNLDLLKKLVRLANNNPNDNEANLAARKVCRMIEEGKFNFGAAALQTPPQTPPKATHQPTTWNDVKRSPEPEFRSRPFSGVDFDWDSFNAHMERIRRERNEYERRTRQQTGREGEGNPIWDIPFSSRPSAPPPRTEPKYGEREKILKCDMCGGEFPTKFVGPPQAYRCNTCHWKVYHASKT